MSMSRGKTSFGDRLRDARLAKGMSQADLAAKTGLQPSAVSHFESERRMPSFDNLRVLADALGVTTDHLLGRDAKPGMAGPTASRLFRRAQEMNQRDLELLAEMADQMVKRKRAEEKE